MIELRSVAKSFSEGGMRRVVFERADARIEAGEFVVLLGRSGSGKSTLLNLVCGIDLPDCGEILAANRCLNTLTEQERTLFRRHSVGFVFQFFNLIPTLTVAENISLPLELVGSPPGERRERTLEMLTMLGLADRAGTWPDRLSGGEQQRVAIGRALIHRPPLLLADEPTGNLDLETGQQVLGLLLDLVRRQGMTLLMATHSREVAERADRILTIRDGALQETTP